MQYIETPKVKERVRGHAGTVFGPSPPYQLLAGLSNSTLWFCLLDMEIPAKMSNSTLWLCLLDMLGIPAKVPLSPGNRGRPVEVSLYSLSQARNGVVKPVGAHLGPPRTGPPRGGNGRVCQYIDPHKGPMEISVQYIETPWGRGEVRVRVRVHRRGLGSPR